MYVLKRHPFKIRAHFDFSLAISFAYPAEVLKPLLVKGLELDTYDNNSQVYGFMTIAMVKVKQLRPNIVPAFLGQDFFLTGYRLFVKYKDLSGRTLRGLYILRSDSNKPLMTLMGSLLTHYKYSQADVQLVETDKLIDVHVQTPKGIADLEVSADVSKELTTPPENSPFPDLKTARRFAGPMPYTFSLEPQTNSMILIEGRRTEWHPQSVAVEVKQASFLRQPTFNTTKPIIANAFIVRDVPYEWQKGLREPLG